jgi:4-O-beta-D-mannosyl-D-glucose phosphorylase
MSTAFRERLEKLQKAYDQLISRANVVAPESNGVYDRYQYPILTAAHTPLTWLYDFNPDTNPYLMERFGINAVFNAGAIKFNGKYILAARVEGLDRK